MAYRVVWSPEALRDVASIAEYISRDSDFYVKSVVRKIMEKARGLANFPFASTIVPELGNPDIRERHIYSYRMVYRIKGDVVTIAVVIHGHRLFSAITDRFEGEDD